MKAGWSTRSLVVAASLLASTARAGPGRVESPTLNRGQVLELSIAPTPDGAPGAAEFLLATELEGPLVIEARSFDHDVVLQRMASDGRLGETADNGGIGWNARLDVQARAAEPVRMQVVFKEPLAGRVAVEILDSSQALPEGFALDVAIAQWKLECGRAAERRGDETSAISAYADGGQLSYRLRLYADCRTAFEALQPLAEKQHDAWLLCVCQGYLGAVTLRAGDAAAARPVLSSARDGAVAQQQGSWELFCQSNLGEACQLMGDLVGARTAYERALFIARTLQDTVNEVSVLSLSAELSILEGDAEEARKAHDHAVTSAEALGQPDLLAQALTSKGRFLRGRGQASDAEAALLQALRVATLPALKAAATGELGNVRLAQGRWPEARLLFDEVLQAATELDDAALEAAALESLGVTAWNAGNPTQATAHWNEALEAYTAQGDRAGRIRVLLDLGAMGLDDDRLADARASLDGALALAEAGPSPALTVQVLGLLTDLDVRDPDRLESALAHAQSQLELSRRTGLADAEARALSALAWVRHRMGRNDEAVGDADKAVIAARRLSPTRLAEALSTQLDVALARRDLATARSTMAEARELLAALPVREAGVEQASLQRSLWSYAQFAELEQDVVALGLSKAKDEAERQALIDEGFRAACRAQGRALLEGISERRGERDPAAAALHQEWQRWLADRDTALTALAASSADAANRKELAARVASCEAKVAALLAEMQARFPAESALDVPPELDPATARRTLLARGARLVQFAEGQQRLYAYLVDDKSATWNDLGDRAEADRLVQRVLACISDPQQHAAPAQIAELGHSAWKTLLAPLLPADGSGTLIILPTSGLAALPFEALVMAPAPRAKSFRDLQFVIDRYEVSYGPSAPVLSLLASIPPRAGEDRFLILADPLVPGERPASASIPRLATESSEWPRLPGTRAEALAIVDLLYDVLHVSDDGVERPAVADGRNGRLSTAAADVFLGADASAARLAEIGRRYSVVHVAAHGAVDASDPRHSGLVLTSTEADDGFLSVPEVLDLDLDADLVVLSACDTARGPIRRGEGVQSLARAFLHAGAREVVATLWQVDDRETEEAMRSFYRGLRVDGLSVSAALRQARLELRNGSSGEGRFAGTGRGGLLPDAPARKPTNRKPSADLAGHPYFWAPFIAIGPAR